MKIKIRKSVGKQTTQKKKKQKWANNKRRTIQSFYNFKSIHDGEIELWNGRVIKYIKITPQSINLVDKDKELTSMISSFKNVFNDYRRPFSLFIQDQFEDIESNKLFHMNLLEQNDHSFLREVIDKDIHLLRNRSLKVGEQVNKDYYIRIEGEVKKREILENTMANMFRLLQENELYPEIPSQKDLKRMMCYFSLNRYIDFPNNELEDVSPELYKDFTKRQLKRRPELREIPGVFEFKDFITPLNFRTQEESIKNGDNVCKIKGLVNVKTIAEQVPVLEKICSMRGITTTLYFDPIDLEYYSEALNQTIRNNNLNSTNQTSGITAEVQNETYSASYKETLMKEDSMYFVSSYFMLTGKNESEVKELEENMRSKGTVNNLIFETFLNRQRTAFYSVSPIGNNIHKRLICQNWAALSVAALYPFNHSGILDKHGMNIGKDDGLTDVLVDFFDVKRDRTNPHIVITGSSGYGKTSFIMNLITNFRAAFTDVYSIDIKDDYIYLTDKLGGLNISLTGENEYAINPLQPKMLKGTTNDMANNISEARRWMRSYKPNWDDTRLDLFEYYFTKEVKRRGLYGSAELHLMKNSDFPVLSDVAALIEHDIAHHDPIKMAPIPVLQELLRSMASAITGADSRMFNRHTYLGDGEDSRHINFIVSDLLTSDQSRKSAQLHNIITYIASKVYRNGKRLKQISVIIDELHEFLKKEYLELINDLDSFCRKFRAFNASLVLSTQTAEEFFDEKISSKIKTLFSLATYKFYFNPGDVDFTEYQKLLQLKDIELNKLKHMMSGKCLARFGNYRFILHTRFREWFSLVKNDINESTVFTD